LCDARTRRGQYIKKKLYYEYEYDILNKAVLMFFLDEHDEWGYFDLSNLIDERNEIAKNILMLSIHWSPLFKYLLAN